MAKRVIMRIELSQTAHDRLQVFADHAGMTQFAICTRLTTWFVSQPAEIQAAILQGLVPEGATVDQLIFKTIVARSKAGQPAKPVVVAKDE